MNSGTTSFVSTISHLKEVTQSINNSKAQDLVTTRSLYVALSKVLESAKYAPQAELVANTNLSALEDIFTGKYILLSKGMQTLLISIYNIILATTPGYAVRNVVNNLITHCANKSILSGSRECAASIVGEVMQKRPMDCGSMVNDVISCMVKLVKGSDHGLRISSLQCLLAITIGSGNRINDCHPELMKVASRLITDKSADIRHGSCLLVTEIARYSGGCTSVTIDLLLAPVVKGLEDENTSVQEVSALAVAIIFNEQIEAYLEEQEQAKIGQARGGSSESENDSSRNSRFAQTKGSLAKLKDITNVGGPKKILDEYDFKSVIKFLIKQILKSSGTLRASYIISLLQLIRLRVSSLEKSEFDWLVLALLGILSDASLASLSYEDTVYFRSRIAYLIRSSITSNLSENSQISLASLLIQFITSTENHTEHELQLALGELAQIITALGEAAVAVLDEVRSGATSQLRNASFGVRAAAAFVLAALASVIPAIAASYLREALTNCASQVRLLTTYDAKDSNLSEESLDAGAGVGSGGTLTSALNISSSTTRKKSPKELERLQRMYCFHGYTMVISIFLKNDKWLPTGLPKDLILEVFDFGLELLKQDVMSAPNNVRHVICSVIRAGSLIVSSCLNLGYKISRSKISRLISHCHMLLGVTTTAATNTTSSNELLYELMSVEAALVCLSTLLWFCPEALVYIDNCLVNVVEGLENAFRAVKSKYQPKFRNHFRFRALHAILLECFAWLPAGSFPNTCQQLFVEALRVFRDSISAGHECTILSEFIRPECTILNVTGIQKAVFTPGGDIPLNESAMMLRLELHAIALQKKESEAFLAAFTKDVRWSDFHSSSPMQVSMWNEPSPPCAHLDSRTVDASIALLAASFGHQTNEYQEKAMQLCSQAVSQFLKANNSLGLFSSEEEKRRKEKKGFIIVKNVITALSAIVRSFPFHNGMSFELDLIWVNSVAERMFEMLSYANVDIRCAAANTLSLFCAKIHGSSLMENMTAKIASTLRGGLEKKNDSMSDYLGYLLALACLWDHSRDMPDIQNIISSVVFDCLKKVDCSLSFRAFSIFAMSIMVKNRTVGASMQDVNETVKLVTRVCHVAETHLICINNSDNNNNSMYDYDLLLVCLQRLINNTVPVILDVDPTSSIIVRFIQLWEMIRSCSTHALLEKEAMDFVVAICLFPPGVMTIDRLSIARTLYSSLEKRGDASFVFLQTTVEAVRALMLQDAECAFQAGLDIELFKLLDWCVASSTVSCSSSYWGLELKPGIESALGTARSLQRSVEAVLDSLIGIEVKQNPDTRAAHWALLCRAVALGLRVGGTGEDDGGQKEGGGGEGETTLEAFERDKKTAVVVQETQTMPLPVFCSWSRDRAVDKAQGISVARVRIKCVAVRCATTALYGVISQTAHTDLAVARKLTEEQLVKLGPKPDSTKLEAIPCYIPLFLHDFVNFACACATYTIEDHRVLSLLAVSAEFLECLLVMFWNCLDPDAISSDDITNETSKNNNRILQQFISQIVSALRTCLGAEWHPSLLFAVGGLATDLMRGAYLGDKVIVRRVAKLLLPVQLSSESSNGSLSVRAPKSDLVADELSTIIHIVSCGNAARLTVLAAGNGPCRNVHPEIKAAIFSLLQDHLSNLVDIWFGMIVDSMRVLEGVRLWPKLDDIAHSYSGGLSYSGAVEVPHLIPYFEMALPYLLAAVTLVPNITLKTDQILAIFVISSTLLEDLKSSHYKSNHNYAHENVSVVLDLGPLRNCGLKNTYLEDLVLYSLTSIIRNYDTNFQIISLSQWNRLLTFLNTRIIPGRLYESTESELDDMLSICATYIDLFESLIHKIDLISNDSTNNIDENNLLEALALLRLGTLATVLPVFDMIFPSEITMQLITSGSIPEILRYPIAPMTIEQHQRLLNLVTSGLYKNFLSVLCNISKSSSSMVVFSVKLLTALIPQFACVLVNHPLKNDVITFIQHQLTALVGVNDNPSTPSCRHFQHTVAREDVLVLLMDDLVLWQEAGKPGFAGVMSKTSTTTQLSTSSSSAQFEVVSSVVEAVILCWKHLALLQQDSIPDPLQLLLLLTSKETPLDYVRAILLISLRSIQTEPTQTGPLLATAVIPCIIIRISRPSTTPEEPNELLMVQIMFLLFTITPENQRETLLSMIIPPLCILCSQRALATPVTQLSGKGITGLARTSPDSFRAVVSSLSEDLRTTLQNVMRFSLEQQAGQSTTATTSSTSESSVNVKKIDMSRYRKT